MTLPARRPRAFPALLRRALAIALALPALLSSPAIPQEPVTDVLTPLLEDYRTLVPPAEGVLLTGGKGTIGSLELDLDQGGMYPLKSRGGVVLGFYFDGAGHYRYHVKGAAERGLFEDNLREHGLGGTYAEGAAADAFERIVVLFARPALHDLWAHGAGEGASPPSRPLGAEGRKAFDVIWKRIMATDLGLDHLAAETALNAMEGQYLVCEIAGKRGTVGYVYDTSRDNREALVGFRSVQGYTLRFINLLGMQRLDAEGSSHAAITLTDVKLAIATPDNRRGTIDSDLTLTSAVEGMRVVTLSLMNNRDRSDVDWTSEKNRLNVRRVLDASGRALPFSHRYRELLVQLAEPARRDEPLRLRVETEGEVFTSRMGDTADNYFELFLDDWFPVPVGRSHTNFSFEIKVQTKKPYRPIAPGRVISSREDGNNFYLETKSQTPTWVIAVFGGKYQVAEEKFGERTIRVHAYASKKNEMPTLLGLSDYFLSFYAHHLGAYPYETLDVVEIPLWGFGIAPAGMVLITSEAYSAHATVQYRDYQVSGNRGINARLAHEIAHQWFPHKAKLETEEDVWLSESVAEYLSGLAMAVAQQGTKEQVYGFKQMYEEWWAEAKYVKEIGPLTASEKISGDEASRQRYGLLYCRGPLVLHMLRTYIGDQAFYAVLKRYLDNAAMGPAGTDDFAKAAAEVLGTNLDWFFDQWIRQGGIPEVTVVTSVETGEDGKPLLRGHAEQAAGAGFKRLYIPIVIDYADGRREAKLLDMNEPVKGFAYPLAQVPKKVTVDPANNNLAIYR